MFRSRHLIIKSLAVAGLALFVAPPVRTAETAEPKQSQDSVTKQAAPGVNGQLVLTVGKSLIIDSPLNIKRLATANGALVQAQAIGPKEVVLNGLAPGETSLIIWQDDGTPNGTRLIYDMTVRVSPQKLNAVREQIARDYPNADVNVTFDNDTAFVRGTVPNTTAADRIMAIVTTMAKAVNLLHVEVPTVEPQVLLKVRFANLDRTAERQLGINWAYGSGNGNITAAGGTSAPPISVAGAAGIAAAASGGFNFFAIDKAINLGAQITALESKNLLETLAEPNLLAYSGAHGAFHAGGQFPVLTPQPSATGVTFTITFKDWGVILNYLPRITPQGTIHLLVNPEVSALDYTNAVSIAGSTVPGLTIQTVNTEVDLENGQTFIIAGMLNKTMTETLSKVPGLGDIPILGKLFQSKTINKSNSELVIMITPEIVRPIPAGQPAPELKWTVPFMSDSGAFPVMNPGMDSTGPVPTHPPSPSLPVEQLILQQKLIQPSPIAAPPVGAPAAAAPPAPAPAAPPAGGGGGGGGAAAGGGAGGGNGQ